MSARRIRRLVAGGRRRRRAVLVPVTLEYWREDKGYGGQLREVPEIISQGRTLAALKRSIKSAWRDWRRGQSRGRGVKE